MESRICSGEITIESDLQPFRKLIYTIPEQSQAVLYEGKISIFLFFPYTTQHYLLQLFMKHGHIFFIMGVSGSGKGTLIKNLEHHGIENLHIPPSYKTRAPRPDEIQGKDAHFVSHDDFRNGIEHGEFLEYAILYGGSDYYGTKYEDVLDNGAYKGKIVIKEIDIHGLKRLQKEHPELRDTYTTIFLSIPSSVLKERIMSRGAPIQEDDFERRLLTASQEIADSKELCDCIIDATQSPNRVLEEVVTLIENFS